MSVLSRAPHLTLVCILLACVPGCHCGGELGVSDAGTSDTGAVDMSTVDQARRDMGMDPLACTLAGTSVAVRVTEVDSIDLLFMVDNSFSMIEEQGALISEIPRLVQVLATGDRNADGVQDFRPLSSIQIGVVTSDMGIGGVSISPAAHCGSLSGDDGVLLTEHGGDDPTCLVAYPPFLEFLSDSDDPATLAQHAACLPTTGPNGCAFEQQLEAVLKALTPADSDVVFEQTRGGEVVRSTRGHGGAGVNGGFLREDSLLAIVMVTDEDDCSSEDVDLYDIESASPIYPVPRSETGQPAPNLQCFAYRHVQYDVLKRYVSGFMALRPDFPSLVVFAAITGVAPDVLAANTTTTAVGGRTFATHDFGGMLASPSMAEVVVAPGYTLAPSCSRPNPDNPLSDNLASPPRRLVSVAEGVEQAGGHGVVASICQARDPDNGDFRADFSPAVDRILSAIANALRLTSP